MLRHGSLVRTVLEGRLPGKKGRGRPKEMLLSWLLQTSEEDMDYSFTTQGVGTGEGKMASTENGNLPTEQNTTAAYFLHMPTFAALNICKFLVVDENKHETYGKV